jgi:hypothetical protein
LRGGRVGGLFGNAGKRFRDRFHRDDS